MTDWDAALSTARITGKPILGCVGSTGCGSCRFVFEKVAADAAVQEQAKNWVIFFAAADKPEVMSRFNIEQSPTFILFSQEGKEEDRVLGLTPAPIIARVLKNHKAHTARRKEVASQIEKGPATAALYRELGDLYMDHAVYYPMAHPLSDLALNAYRKAAEMDPALGGQLADRIYFCDAVLIKDRNQANVEQMDRKLEKFETLFPRSPLLPQVPFYRLLAALARQEEFDKEGYFNKAIKRFPNEEFTQYYRLFLLLMTPEKK